MDEFGDLGGLFAAFADGIAFGELYAALFRYGRGNRRAVLFQHPGNPVADAAHGLHLAVLKAVERAAIIKEPAHLFAQAHGGVLNRGPFPVIQIPKAGAIAIHQAHHAQVGQMPVKMPDLALKLRLPETGIALRLFLGDRILVVGHTQMAAAQHHRIQLSICPMAGELFEILVQHVVQRIIRCIQRIDISGGIQLLDKFRIRQDQIISPRRRLRDQCQHVVATGIIFGDKFDIIGGLIFGDHIRFAMAIPCQHVDLGRCGPCAADERCRQNCRPADPQKVAPGRCTDCRAPC